MRSRGATTDKMKVAIEVINLSHTNTMTLNHVGFARRFAESRFLIWDPATILAIVPSGGSISGRKIEPLTRVIVYTHFTARMIFDNYGSFSFAIAETESGKVFRGSSPILKHIRKSLRRSSI